MQANFTLSPPIRCHAPPLLLFCKWTPIAPCFYLEVQIHQDAVSISYVLEIPCPVNVHVQGVHLLGTC